MPSLLEYKSLLANNGQSIGQAQKYNSDMIIEQTWDRDIQSKKCYIYDYFHDDQPWLNEGMSYENTTKTKIDAKFIITQYQSLDKDRVTVLLEFKPSQKLRFKEGDALYYYETDYKGRFNSDFPIGMYCDIPDDNGVYHKWIICAKQISNQFIKYLILPANYRFSWIEFNNQERVIRRVWGATRSQNSYNSGLWSAYYTTEIENQFKAILPMNSITENIFYVDNLNQNQRFVISSMTKNPRTWQVSKYEDMIMGEFGLLRLTFAQVAFNPATDFIDYNALNPDDTKDVYAMYADYYISNIKPIENEIVESESSIKCVLTTTTNTIKTKGSYKTITATFYDKNSNDITDTFISEFSIKNWSFYIEDEEVSQSGLLSILEHNDFNKIKIRINANDDYITKILSVKCQVKDIVGEISLEIICL